MIGDKHFLLLKRKKSRKWLSLISITGQFLYSRAKMREIALEIDLIT